MTHTISKNQLRKEMNEYGKNKQPFYFLTDFSLQNNVFIPAQNIHNSPFLFNFEEGSTSYNHPYHFVKNPPKYTDYLAAFQQVQTEIQKGNSYIVNLTFQSKISTNLSLNNIFHASKAKYKLLWKDKFVVFSPETFVKIQDGIISTYPMKGTIDAELPNADQLLLQSTKESAEHSSIVDLLRNDLSIHTTELQVTRFKYLDKVKTSDGEILQMSSEIVGKLKVGYLNSLGDILIDLLPAGSVSGAPKQQTIKIINEVENYNRGYYCGVAGYFDGSRLNSFVMIRFIEQTEDGMVFKSGGGIHSLSDPEKEYEELIKKIYVPIY